MNMSASREIYFVYDGDCPLCRNAAMALKIKQEYGRLVLMNARESYEHAVVQEINNRGFDLDEGMVIYDGEQFYHGKDALRFMARFSDNKGLFNLMSKVFCRFEIVNGLVYPWMRGIRNWLLRRKNIQRIDNLGLKEQPIFKSIFGAAWDGLPPVMKRHYANRPYMDDVTVVEGHLDVSCAGPIKWFAPLFWLMRGIPPANEKNVPVTVQFESDKDTKFFHFNRVFRFNGGDYVFKSRMIQTKGDEVIEVMRSRLGWKMRYMWEDGKVKLIHKGYVLYAFGHFIPMPLTFLIGVGHAEETPIDDDNFDMFVTITHPWFGQIYKYKGRFEVIR